MSELKDRRKEVRELVVSFTLVYESAQGKLLGYLRDLTMKGAQVSGNKVLTIGSPITLSIALPPDLPGVIDKRLEIDAKVARCVLVTEDPVNYEIGFEFAKLEARQSEVIEKLLTRYQFRHV